MSPIAVHTQRRDALGANHFRKRFGALPAVAVTLLALGVPTRGVAWSLFERENRAVARGNRAFARGDFARAGAAYKEAEDTLPGDATVALNQGLAHLRLGEYDKAEEAFLRSLDGDPREAVRRDALYNLGLSLFRRARAARTEHPEEAGDLFRGAADSFRDALRLAPGNRDAAWNYELARQEAERADAEAQSQENEAPKDPKEQPPEDPEEQGDTPAPSEEPKENASQQGDDNDAPGPSNDPAPDPSPTADGPGTPEDAPEGADPHGGQREPGEPLPSQETDGNASDRPAESPTEPQDARERALGQAHAPALPPEVMRVLDAVQANERSLQVEQARARAQGRARPVQDW